MEREYIIQKMELVMKEVIKMVKWKEKAYFI